MEAECGLQAVPWRSPEDSGHAALRRKPACSTHWPEAASLGLYWRAAVVPQHDRAIESSMSAAELIIRSATLMRAPPVAPDLEAGRGPHSMALNGIISFRNRMVVPFLRSILLEPFESAIASRPHWKKKFKNCVDCGGGARDWPRAGVVFPRA